MPSQNIAAARLLFYHKKSTKWNDSWHHLVILVMIKLPAGSTLKRWWTLLRFSFWVIWSHFSACADLSGLPTLRWTFNFSERQQIQQLAILKSWTIVWHFLNNHDWGLECTGEMFWEVKNHLSKVGQSYFWYKNVFFDHTDILIFLSFNGWVHYSCVSLVRKVRKQSETTPVI